MITLNQLIEKLQEIKNQHNSFGELPVIYSHDDEGNEYQKVNNEPGLFSVENINDNRFLEPNITGKETKPEDFNCIIIN